MTSCKSGQEAELCVMRLGAKSERRTPQTSSRCSSWSQSTIAQRVVCMQIFLLYATLAWLPGFAFPIPGLHKRSHVPSATMHMHGRHAHRAPRALRGEMETHSLKYGRSMRIMLWIDTSTCSSVDFGDHCSSGLRFHSRSRSREVEADVRPTSTM